MEVERGYESEAPELRMCVMKSRNEGVQHREDETQISDENANDDLRFD